jgi:hypothetical protein
MRTADPRPPANPAITAFVLPGPCDLAMLIFQLYNVFISKFLANSRLSDKILTNLDSDGKITPEAMMVDEKRPDFQKNLEWP